MMTIVPANEASFDDLEAVFGTRGDPSRCYCQRYKLRPREAFAKFPAEERAFRLRQQTRLRHADSDTTSGLVAYLDGEPVGWCAVEPRTAYEGLLRNNRVPWDGPDGGQGRRQRVGGDLLSSRAGFRRRGISHALARAAVDCARESGARALEGVSDGHETDHRSDELHVGSRSIFAAAGFAEVSRPDPPPGRDAVDFRR